MSPVIERLFILNIVRGAYFHRRGVVFAAKYSLECTHHCFCENIIISTSVRVVEVDEIKKLTK